MWERGVALTRLRAELLEAETEREDFRKEIAELRAAMRDTVTLLETQEGRVSRAEARLLDAQAEIDRLSAGGGGGGGMGAIPLRVELRQHEPPPPAAPGTPSARLAQQKYSI